jgi:hypothetical protein
MMREFSATEKLNEVKRELKLRRPFYRRQVELGKMNPHTAALQIAIMEAIQADYEQQQLAAGERLL